MLRSRTLSNAAKASSQMPDIPLTTPMRSTRRETTQAMRRSCQAYADRSGTVSSFMERPSDSASSRTVSGVSLATREVATAIVLIEGFHFGWNGLLRFLLPMV